jgi:hypothetical protein
MRQFVMSQYATKEDLYKAKARYYEKLADAALERLMDIEEVMLSEDGEYVWNASGEALVEYYS